MSTPTDKPLRSSLGDRVFSGLSTGAGVFVLSIAAALVAVLTYQAWPALVNLGDLSKCSRVRTGTRIEGTYGALLFVYGTLATSLIAMLVAVPLGVGAAAYLSEIAPPRVRRTCSFLLELLAAIPSVIFGFWAVDFLARRGLAPTYEFFGLKSQSGEGIVAAGLVLAVMILPYITALSLRRVPGGAAVAARRVAVPGRDALADDLAGGAAVRPAGDHRGVLPRARPGGRRDDGRDDGDRQRAAPRLLADRDGRLDPEHHRQAAARDRPGRHEQAGGPDRAGPVAARHHAGHERRGAAARALGVEAARAGRTSLTRFPTICRRRRRRTRRESRGAPARGVATTAS